MGYLKNAKYEIEFQGRHGWTTSKWGHSNRKRTAQNRVASIIRRYTKAKVPPPKYRIIKTGIYTEYKRRK